MVAYAVSSWPIFSIWALSFLVSSEPTLSRTRDRSGKSSTKRVSDRLSSIPADGCVRLQTAPAVEATSTGQVELAEPLINMVGTLRAMFDHREIGMCMIASLHTHIDDLPVVLLLF